jgi:hypothetical protein
MAGLLDIFGTSGAETMGLLGMSPEDVTRNRDEAQAQALFALAGRLFQGGRGGASIVEGLQQGQQAYKTAMQGSLQQQLQNAQIQDMLRKRQQEQAALAEQRRIQSVLGQSVTPEVQARPSQEIMEDGRFIGDSAAVQARPAGFDLGRIAPQLMATPEGRKTLSELVASQKAMAGETFKLGEGEKQYQRNPITGEVKEVAAGAPKEKATPAELQGYNFAVSQGYKGSFIDYQTALKKAGAGNTVLNVANKTFGSEFAKGAGEAVNTAFTSAQGAVGTLGRIESLKPVLEGGKLFSGTLAGSQVAAARIADALNIGGKDNAERLQNTAVAMQQLAGLELNAAEAMKGQGAITENERNLIKRAAGGDLMNMTAKEVSSLLNSLEKTSKYKISIHESNLKRLKQNPELSSIAQYYELPTISTTPTVDSTVIPSGVTVKRKP